MTSKLQWQLCKKQLSADIPKKTQLLQAFQMLILKLRVVKYKYILQTKQIKNDLTTT